jgi:galactokinase
MITQALRQTLIEKHLLCFGTTPTHLFQTPGRVELFGGYTSFHGGLTLSMAIDQSLYASLSMNSLRSIRIFSSGYPAMTMSLDQGVFLVDQSTLSNQVVQKIFHHCQQLGCHFEHGFDVFIQSDFSKFSSLASSTAFSLTILEVFLMIAPSPQPLSIHQKAYLLASVEREDQTHLSKIIDAYPLYQGGIHLIDANHGQQPQIQRLTYRFKDYRFVLLHVPNLVVHPRWLTNQIKELMGTIAQHYQKESLSQIDGLDFQHDLTDLIRMYGQKAVNKVHFFFQENKRAQLTYLALEKLDESLLGSLTAASLQDQHYLLDAIQIPGQQEQHLAKTVQWLNKHTPMAYVRLHSLGFQGPLLMVIPRVHFKDVYRLLKYQFSEHYLREIKNVNKGFQIYKL